VDLLDLLHTKLTKKGYDVFLGTFRGCRGKPEHINEKISSKDYWNFSINDHAFKDFPAFVEKIIELKKLELQALKRIPKIVDETNQPLPFRIDAVAHSMGAMACLMYIIYSRMNNKQHFLSSAILLSPGGCHNTAPLLIKLLAPLLNIILFLCPWIHSFRFPSEFSRLLIAKLMEDVNENYTMRNIASYLSYKLLGGKVKDHAFVKIHNITYNIFAGTSVRVYKHFLQLWKTQRFQAFDYGKQRNLQEYGTPQPIDFFKNFDKIDVPIYFVMGLCDTLIPPASVMTHYATLNELNPKLAHLKAFPKMGHIDFTVGAKQSLSNYIFDIFGGKEG